TAQAIIITDQDNNQITAFHPGAMQYAHEAPIVPAQDIELAIIAPDGRQAMLDHAEQLAAAGVPFVFDPGQGLPMFDGAELRRFIDLATWITVNDYEGRMLCERTGLSPEAMSRQVRALIITLGAEGCEVWQDGARAHVPGVTAEQVVDPTGCGDAFRGALLHGLQRGWEVTRCVTLANQVGAIKIAQAGPQNHVIPRDLRA
ncbi:MAG: carbohydrate kinase family protein, partial [Dechloromonas sp.]|nr:carbohydrate kinase family protein [Dechloromonas sp.]